MATYFIGDIQGCYSELIALLKQVDFNPRIDELWVAGDMIARGPDSLKTLQYLISQGSAIKAVLGNHDLHFLAIHAGIKKAKPNDKLDKLLCSKDLPIIIDWLKKQPLLRKLPHEDVYMSHAGFPPQWTIETCLKQAKSAEKKIQSSQSNQWLLNMYGEKPNDWHKVKTKQEQFRYTVNALTRMRYCFSDGRLEFDCKNSPIDAPEHLKPWFEIHPQKPKSTQWVFGHWAALMGNVSRNNIYALDTGCVWGGHLTLLRWEDKQIFKENAHVIK